MYARSQKCPGLGTGRLGLGLVSVSDLNALRRPIYTCYAAFQKSAEQTAAYRPKPVQLPQADSYDLPSYELLTKLIALTSLNTARYHGIAAFAMEAYYQFFVTVAANTMDAGLDGYDLGSNATCDE